MNIVQQLSKSLPCDLQWKILREYTQRYILPDLTHNKVFLRVSQRSNRYAYFIEIISMYVQVALLLFDKGVEHFHSRIDMLEERLLDDEWFVWDSSHKTIKILDITKKLIHYPHLLKIDLATMLWNNDVDTIYILCKDIVMLTRMLR